MSKKLSKKRRKAIRHELQHAYQDIQDAYQTSDDQHRLYNVMGAMVRLHGILKVMLEKEVQP